MDDKLTIRDLKEKVRDFCEVRDWDQYHSPKDLAIGIVTEASELLEIFRFKSESESQKFIRDYKKKKAISEEIADVLYFVLRFSQMYNIDLSDELHKKIRINNKKYPVNKSRGKNVKYTEL